MSYPESAGVSAGDATLASHYNNLRADAVHLGEDSGDAVALGVLLERYESRLEVERLETTKIRVPASASVPVSLIIDGFLCQAVANVDLAGGEVPAGAAAAYYIFANRTDDSTTFTLTVNTVSTEAADQRRIGRFYWNGSAIVKDSVRTEHAGLIADLLYFTDPQICDGRLTLSTGVPITISDVSSAANVYFTPYLGNRIALYVNDYGWRLYPFSELTLDISGVADEKNIDIWIYDDAGTLTLAYTLWTNDTLRATALVRQDGVLCKTGALEYRYLGTVRTSAAGETSDTLLKRFVWNFYNRVERKIEIEDDTDSWTYNTDTWRQMRAETANKIECVIGLDEKLINIIFSCHVSLGAAEGAQISIGLDSITAFSGDASVGRAYSTDIRQGNVDSYYLGYSGIGYHYYAPLEFVDSGDSVIFYGDDGLNFRGVIHG